MNQMDKYFRGGFKGGVRVDLISHQGPYSSKISRPPPLVFNDKLGHEMYQRPTTERSGRSTLCRIPSIRTTTPNPNPHTLLGSTIREQCLHLKLKRIMAVEVVKNRVKMDLKKIMKQIDSQINSGKKEFMVLGGGARSLNYVKTLDPSGTLCILQVDIKGYIPSNVAIDTNNNRMTIRATKVNGKEKGLGLLAPSTEDLDKVEIKPPLNGCLILTFPRRI